MPPIPPLSGLPSGRFEDVATPDYDFRDAADPDPYLEPYRHYIDNPFIGNVAIPRVPWFQSGGHERDPSLRKPGRRTSFGPPY